MELKPCPFCGHRDPTYIDEHSQIFGKGVKMILCPRCGGAVFSNSKNDAFIHLEERWNRRVQITEVRQYGVNPTNITNVGELNLNL